VAIATSVGLLLLRRRWPGPLAAWAAYLALLAPNAGFVWGGDMLSADRYSYLSTMSFAILAAAGLDQLGRSRRLGALARGMALVTVLALMALSWQQCRTWRDTESLLSNALVHGGGRPPELYGHLASLQIRQNRYRAALESASRLLRADPASATTHSLLGMALHGLGRHDEAIAQFNEALRINPDLHETHSGLGMALSDLGRYDEAIAHYRRAAALNPHFAKVHNNWGAALAFQGKLDAAIDQLSRAVELKPDLAEAQYNLGRTLYRKGRLDEAIAHLSMASQLEPSQPLIRRGLAEALAARRRRTARSGIPGPLGGSVPR
jgi:tetratricopeptide (TPR) repeat protein